MKLYNTLGRQLQQFEPLAAGKVKIYTCGPTVYDYQHIGNYSGYIYWDILVRLFKYSGFDVNRIMNITDVGHLVSDADEGEDKLETGAKREGKSAREVADFFTNDFYAGMKALKLVEPNTYAKATEYIPQQIEIIQALIDKGFAYKTEQAIYFEVAKLPDYGKLTGQKLSEKEVGARAEVITDDAKHHPQDFALWFFRAGRFANHELHWPSPWGDGFPGWHIECSAIVHALLGDPIDIHTGGVDHIGTHHTNEIAQTEAAYGHPLANYWLHNNHMMVDGQKMSKSLGNFLTLADLAKRGYSALDFKLLVLQSHYRSMSNFTWEALAAAQQAYKDICAWADLSFQQTPHGTDELIDKIKDRLSDDLNTPQAIAVLMQTLDVSVPSHDVLKKLDNLLGLELSSRQDIDNTQKDIVAKRQEARRLADWQQSDQLRDQLAKQGIGLRDSAAGATWYRL